jgi:uncharacterized protein
MQEAGFMDKSRNQRRRQLFALLMGTVLVQQVHADDFRDEVVTPLRELPQVNSPIMVPAVEPVLEGFAILESAEGAVEFNEQTELLQQRYPNGDLNIERFVAEDTNGNLVNHGLYRELDTNGRVIRSGEYQNGKLNGTWTQVVDIRTVRGLVENLDSGFKAPFVSEATFEAGQLQGHWSITDSQGRPVLLWQFADGQRDNVSTWFDSRGNVMLEINYVAGVPHGSATIMASGKKEPEKVIFDQGRVLRSRTEWHDPQAKTKKKFEETLQIPAGHTVQDHSWWNTTVNVLPLDSQVAIRHGAFTAWYPNGQKQMTGTYRLGEPHGEFQWWYTNGQPQGTGNFAGGEMHGRWVWWHDNGMKKTDGMYISNRKEGLWSSWDEEGRIVFRGPASEMEETKEQSIVNEAPADDHIGEAAASETDQRAQLPATLPASRINAALLNKESSVTKF